MSPIVSKIARSSPLILIATLIWLPRAVSEDSGSRPATSKPAVLSQVSKSQPSDREVELRQGRQIIEETVAVYKDCNSYQDEGEVVTIFFTNKGPRTYRTPFKTAFRRAYRFRFEFRNPISDPGKYIVWANQNDVRTWAYVLVEKPARLGLAIAGATDDSSGSAHTIPSLLLPKEIGGQTLADLQNIRLADQEMSHGALYNILEAEEHDGSPVRIWIDADTKLICKILTKKTCQNFRIEETTTYKPKVNINVAKDLDFNAPTISVDQRGHAIFSDK